jgi:hypothetical protein
MKMNWFKTVVLSTETEFLNGQRSVSRKAYNFL